MRSLTVLLSAALLPTALVAVPAQASGGTLTASMNLQTGLASVVASSGFGAFAEDEELQITSETPGGYTISLAGTPTHTLTAGANCIARTSTSVVCSSVMVVPKLAVSVNLATVTGATTTVVIDGAFTPALTFTGGSGEDYVQGGSAADEIFGGPGNDDLFGGPGDDKISGEAGDDNIDGEEGNDSVGGGSDNDFVVGGDGADSITGGPGVDALDSEDQLKDTYVSCDNAPGQGKIDYDKGLDIPFACPVVLPPTAPRDVSVDGGTDSITVSWAAPEFDGNAQRLTYEITVTAPGGVVAKPVEVAGTETSYTVTNLVKKGLYSVSMRAVNEVGQSAATTPVPVSVGGVMSPPQSVDSLYFHRGNATLSWVPPEDGGSIKYEIALRVKDKAHKNWLAWRTLPDLQNGVFMMVHNDLQIANGRVYQFRVRGVDSKGNRSAWTNSVERFVGNLTSPANGRILRGGKSTLDVAFDLNGLAWTYNATATSIFADVTTQNYYYGIDVKYATVRGSSYQVTMTGLPSINKTSRCAVGVGYLDAAGTAKQLWSPVTCPAS